VEHAPREVVPEALGVKEFNTTAWLITPTD